MDGVLVIDKPLGPTSFDVVRRVRDCLKAKKVGHTGTLDPLATGVLPLCIGEATKIARFILHSDKSYDAVLALGRTTDTQDAAGKVLLDRPVPPLTPALIESVLAKFRGPLSQKPPMYSAVKVNGKRLYELAREGEEVERAARDVVVHQLELRDAQATELSISLKCSKGFYVRVLAEEIGEALGCGAHLKALRRTQTGPFTLSHALDLDTLEEAAKDPAALRALTAPRWVSLSDALSELPVLTVTDSETKSVLHGVPLETTLPLETTVRIHTREGRLIAVGQVEPRGRLGYLRVLGGRSP